MRFVSRETWSLADAEAAEYFCEKLIVRHFAEDLLQAINCAAEIEGKELEALATFEF